MIAERSRNRLERKLKDALGEVICRALEEPTVVEIMMNPDGRLYVERLGETVVPLGRMDRIAVEIVIGSVAHAVGREVDEYNPIVSAELPIGGHRFEGLLPPVVASPSFSIRKKAARLIPLEDYVAAGVMTARQASVLTHAVKARRNIVVSGGTGSGKTTLANALIAEIARHAPADRLVVLEDTAELRIVSENAIALRSTDDVDLARLLKSTMRLRPDRIIVGEVRDGAALSLLKAWNTGHPGGIATVHANSARAALRRLEQLTAEVSQQSMHAVIGDTVDLVVQMERVPTGRRVTELLNVVGHDGMAYQFTSDDGEKRHAA
jgi:P-type conjugative transfer ATPase TrbB